MLKLMYGSLDNGEDSAKARTTTMATMQCAKEVIDQGDWQKKKRNADAEDRVENEVQVWGRRACEQNGISGLYLKDTELRLL